MEKFDLEKFVNGVVHFDTLHSRINDELSYEKILLLNCIPSYSPNSLHQIGVDFALSDEEVTTQLASLKKAHHLVENPKTFAQSLLAKNFLEKNAHYLPPRDLTQRVVSYAGSFDLSPTQLGHLGFYSREINGENYPLALDSSVDFLKSDKNTQLLVSRNASNSVILTPQGEDICAGFTEYVNRG